MSEEKKTKKKRAPRTKKDDPGFTQIDMSTMQPVNGKPIVTFRIIGR